MDMPETVSIPQPEGRDWRALVVSDTHGHTSLLKQICQRVGDVDAVIHLGDVASDTRVLDGPIFLVSGNCDIDASAPYERLLAVGQWRIFLTHGHRYGVKRDLLRLALRARELGSHMALFGHTHRGSLSNTGVLLANPGSVMPSRNPLPCYAILRVNRKGLEFDIKEYGN